MEELDELLAEPVVFWVFQQFLAAAGPREWHVENFSHLSLRAIGHHHDAVG
jgi:hypothetical protein